MHTLPDSFCFLPYSINYMIYCTDVLIPVVWPIILALGPWVHLQTSRPHVTLPSSPNLTQAARDVEYALKKGDQEVAMKATHRLEKLTKGH